MLRPPGIPISTCWMTNWYISDADDKPKINRLYRFKPWGVEKVVSPREYGWSSIWW